MTEQRSNSNLVMRRLRSGVLTLTEITQIVFDRGFPVLLKGVANTEDLMLLSKQNTFGGVGLRRPKVVTKLASFF